MKNFEVAETLKMGLKFLETDGWTKGNLQYTQEELDSDLAWRKAHHPLSKQAPDAVGYCAIGAANKAATGSPYPPSLDDHLMAPASVEACDYLARQVAQNPPSNPTQIEVAVYRHNDNARSFAEVKDMFTRAIKEAESE